MKFFAVAAAMTKATGNDLGKAFVADPNEETMNAILDAAEKNLRRLIRTGGKEAPAKRSTAKKAAKPAAAKTTKRTAVAKKATVSKNALAKEFKIGTRVRVVKRDGDKFVGVVESHKNNGAKIRLKTGELEYGRYTQMTALAAR